MAQMSRADAENLAEQICDALRPQIVRVVADLPGNELPHSAYSEMQLLTDFDPHQSP
jgi:hypothetical protein